MNPYLIQQAASFQIADRIQQAEQSRLARQVRAARRPARLAARPRLQWLTPWFSSPHGPRMA
ncbi:MAG: hypothetical protein L0H96_06770 [Humibacillus sp.]|nr:hypothetical protein [Humibacillus sp.]MDN5776595.1 hypothetical protein [Humibacillus sp.]